jgi:hypothetical protein
MWPRLCSLSCTAILLELMSFWVLSTSPWPTLMCTSDLETGEWHIYIIRTLIYKQDAFSDGEKDLLGLTYPLYLQFSLNCSTLLRMFEIISSSSTEISARVDCVMTKRSLFFSFPRFITCYFRWYDLKSKPGKEKSKPRGELEVRVAFLVKAGSLTDLSKKPHRSSMGHLSHMAHSVGKCEIGEHVIWNHLCCPLFGAADAEFCSRW